MSDRPLSGDILAARIIERNAPALAPQDAIPLRRAIAQAIDAARNEAREALLNEQLAAHEVEPRTHAVRRDKTTLCGIDGDLAIMQGQYLATLGVFADRTITEHQCPVCLEAQGAAP